MLNGTFREKSSLLFQVSHDLRICSFDIDTFVGYDFLGELAILINGHRCIAWLDDACINTHFEIIFTETWSTVNNTSTSVC